MEACKAILMENVCSAGVMLVYSMGLRKDDVSNINFQANCAPNSSQQREHSRRLHEERSREKSLFVGNEEALLGSGERLLFLLRFGVDRDDVLTPDYRCASEHRLTNVHLQSCCAISREKHNGALQQTCSDVSPWRNQRLNARK